MGYFLKILRLFPLLWLMGPVSIICAQEVEDNLVRISLDVFPKLVAVDLDMKNKLSEGGQIRLQVFYSQKKELALSVVQQLKERYPNIAALPVQVEARSAFTADPPTAIFLVERFQEKPLRNLINYGISNGILVFSPFKEDVDRGVTAGIYLSVRILPYFNHETLKRSGINMHKILLKSAKFYE